MTWTINEGADFVHTVQDVAVSSDSFQAVLVDRFGRLVLVPAVEVDDADINIVISKGKVGEIPSPVNIRPDEASVWGGWYYITRLREGVTSRIASGKWFYSPVIRGAV